MSGQSIPRHRRLRLRLLAVASGLAAGAALLLSASGAVAATGRLSAQYQGYASGGSHDPYAGDNPQDVHVDGFGGQPVVTGYVRLNLDSLPAGSTIDGLKLTLTPNSSQSDNVAAAQAAIEACILDQPLSSNGYQASPPPYDCNKVHATGASQANGDWTFELAPLARQWEQKGNTGLALVAYPPPNGTPIGAAPSAWSVAFDHTKTAAAADYTPGALSSTTFFGPAAVPAPVQPVPGGVVPAPAPAVQPAPAVNPVPAPSVPPSPGRAATPTTPTIGSAPPQATQARVSNRWVWLTAALGGAALLMLLVGAGQQLLRGGGPLRLGARLGSALSVSRSQLATPVAVLALAAVFALGFTGQALGVTGGAAGGSALGAAGGTGGSGGTGSGSAPGSTATGSSSAPGSTGPGATGRGSLGPGGSGPGSGPSGIAASTNGGLDGPGVTSTTVRLGFVYVTNTQAANNAFGFKVADVGNEQSEEQALVAYVNHHGGIAGRQIQPVYVAVDNAQAESDPTIGEEVCHKLTEDYHVFAVIGGAGPPDDANANACYAQAGTLNFDAQAAVDLTFLKQASPYIWPTEEAALDRTMRMEIGGLQNRGFFSGSPNHKLGVVIAQDPVNDRVYQQVTLPALQAAGVRSPDTFYVPHDTVSDIANTMKQAVVHFQVDGVTNVIFQGGGSYGVGSYAILFMVDAASQHYNPRYGLSSDDAPVALAQNVPEDQLQGALAVGISPGTDTDDQHYGQWPFTPGEKKCASIESAAGNSFSSREGALVIILLCDSVFEFQDGAQALSGQPLNAQLWADQAMKLGSNVFNAGMYRRYIGPGHWDTAGGYRLLHAMLNCEGSSACFVYDNANTYSG
ncbi:MAG: ABC transporter substrate-binding protein [Chloroflexi bacterium]|nr:MAG: ABC transporter substrate-binding protein [Chloroflexota bacterium]